MERERWQYHVEPIAQEHLQEHLKRLGNIGWELVSAYPSTEDTHTYPGLDERSTQRASRKVVEVTALFKRRAEPEEEAVKEMADFLDEAKRGH